MESTCIVFILALAVFRASAHTISFGCGGGLGSLDHSSIRIPEFLQAGPMQTACASYKTIVRPQVRKEVFTVPSSQRFVQTASAPVLSNSAYLRPELSTYQLPQTSGVVGETYQRVSSGGVLSGLGAGIFRHGYPGAISGGFPVVNEGFIGNGAGLGGIMGSTYSGVAGGEFACNNFLPGSSLVETGIVNGGLNGIY